MVVLIPCHSFYPAQEGGSSNALYWLATGLAKVGINVHVITTNRNISSGQVVENIWTRFNNFDVEYASIDKQGLYLKEEIEKCDILIANGVFSIRNIRLNRRALCLAKKVILSPRGELLDSAVKYIRELYVMGQHNCLNVDRLPRNTVSFAQRKEYRHSA